MIEVTLAEVKQALRYDSDTSAMDADLNLRLRAASGIVENHCDGTDFDALKDSDKDIIKVAVLQMVAYLDDKRQGVNVDPSERAWLPPAVAQLLLKFHNLAGV